MSAADTPRLPATFNRLAWSNLAAQSAEQIALAAAPIVAVLLLGVGEGQTGLLQTALTLPFILFAIPAGLLTDRISRRMLMAGSEALRAVALFAILAAIASGMPESRNVSSTITPSVPSEPTKSRVRSYPAADLRARRAVRITRPSASTTVRASTFSRIVP